MTPAPEQDGGAGEEPDEDVDGGFGGKRAQKNAAADGGFGIGIGKPGMQWRNGGADGHADENEPKRGAAVMGGAGEGPNGEVCPFGAQEKNAAEQDGAAKDVHQEIAQTCGLGTGGATIPDDEERCHSHEFPENKQGDEIAGKDHPEGRPGIDKGRSVFAAVPNMEGVKASDSGSQAENEAEDVA